MIEPSKVKRFGCMVGGSRRMRRVFSMIRKGAAVDMPVLIIGETGSGKGLVARELHMRSERRDKPYIAFNTGAVAPELVASELFGHRKGAFTGATENKVGRFCEANGGTLFLDEIGTMDARMQVSLLRALDAGKIRPIGAKRDVATDFRLVAATNENLDQAVREGRFRDDLLYRLRVLCIKLPALRHRTDDIPMLCSDFLRSINKEYHFNIQGISDEAMQALQEYEWPGNLRELKNVLAQSTVTAVEGEIQLEHLPSMVAGTVSISDIEPEPLFTDATPAPLSSVAPATGTDVLPEAALVDSVPPPSPSAASAPVTTAFPPAGEGEDGAPALPKTVEDGLFIPVGTTLEDVQRAFTLKTLQSCGNNKTQAAKLLNVSRKALYDKLVRWGDDKHLIQ